MSKPSRALTLVVQDAKALVRRIESNLAAFKTSDKDRTDKTPALLAKLKKSIAQTESAAKVQKAKKTSVKLATRGEVGLRIALASAITVVRDDVKDGVDDRDVQRAFGVGKKITPKSTTDLVGIADGVLASWETHQKIVKPAGVTKAKIDAIQKARDALSEGDAAQGDAIGAGKTATASKSTSTAALTKLVKRLRDRAKSVERVATKVGAKTKTKVKSAFANTSPARKSRTRVKKSPATPAAPTAPTKTGTG